MSELRDLRSDGRMSQDEHEERLSAARAVSGWELGSPSWASKIIAAYMNPDAARRELAEARGSVSEV